MEQKRLMPIEPDGAFESEQDRRGIKQDGLGSNVKMGYLAIEIMCSTSDPDGIQDSVLDF